MTAVYTKPGTGSDSFDKSGWLPVGYLSGEIATISTGGLVKCPHCNRDWHTKPLTRRVADMVRNHKFDPAYRAAEDESPVECVGSDVYGPNRDISAQRREISMGIKVGAPWVTYVMDEAIQYAKSTLHTIVGVGGWTLPNWPSMNMKLWFDEPYLLEPECPGELPDVNVEFGPEHWPIAVPADKWAPLSTRERIRKSLAKVNPNQWIEPTPLPESPARDFSAIVEDFNKQYPTYPKGKNHEGF